jgi:hypothetical protein
VTKSGRNNSLDVARIIAELRSVQKGIGEGILILERSQPATSTAEAASGSFAGMENQPTQISAMRVARSRKKVVCRRVAAP